MGVHERSMGAAMPDDDLAQRMAAFGTATVADALDRLGIHGTCLGITAIDPGFRLAGRARTVRYGPAGVMKGTVGDFVDGYAPGTVAVLDNLGRLDCTVWGDILTECAHRSGLAGTVIDGVCRDTALCRELGYPVFARGAFMRTGKDRVQVEDFDVPVSIGGVRIVPRDILIGDADGVVVVPSECAQAVLEAASEIDEREERIRQAVRAGSSLAEARSAFGYHSLQSRQA
jgi:4-hydroxy-4-methyl-2-oxoglutarate aldolase